MLFSRLLEIKQKRFPILFLLFKHYSIIPATSAASESAFSQLSCIITKNRNRLQSNTVKQLILLKSWGILQYNEKSNQKQLQKEYLSDASSNSDEEITIGNPIAIENNSITNAINSPIVIEDNLYGISSNDTSSETTEANYDLMDKDNSANSARSDKEIGRAHV